jgi:hypothetical protein
MSIISKIITGRIFQKRFPATVFGKLQQKALVPMVTFLQMCCLGKCTGISFIDSMPVCVCHIKREHSHKVFKGIVAQKKIYRWSLLWL